MVGSKLKSINFSEIADKVYLENPEATVWDIFVEILSRGDNKEKYRIWILSELPIIEAVASGYDGIYIQDALGVDKRLFEKVCKFWGLISLDYTMDFDPLESYTKGMTPLELKAKVLPIVIGVPSIKDLEICIHNVKIYKDIIEYLNELEEN